MPASAIQDAPTLSVIVPVFNEQDALPHTYQRLDEVLNSLACSYEVIIIDNGSIDDTEAIAQRIVRENLRWRYIRLSRNFTYQNSTTAAMAMAHGEAIVVIDADLQDPPEMIADFLKYWL